MNQPILKETLYQFCLSFAKGRISRIQASLSDVRISLESEDKSSAGDQHETGRAMLQLEQEKLGQQLAEAQKMLDVMDKIKPKTVHTTIGLGAFATTTKANYFLSVSAGEFKQNDDRVYCISISTPIGQLLLGKSVGDSVVFNEEEIKVLKVS